MVGGPPPRASFEIIGNTFDAIFLLDKSEEDNTITITNDAEFVTQWVSILSGSKRIYYLDSMREWTELVHDGNGKFIEFSHPKYG